MSTARKLISQTRGRHRLLSIDASINDRLILSEIKSIALLLIKRETNLRKLWNTDTVFTTIPCLEMVEVPISECGSYVDDVTIARSKYKFPKIAEGNYQYLIQGVYSINAMSGKGKRLKEITINRYMNLLKLDTVKKEDYFWIMDDYLYVTNNFVQAVRISALFEETPSNDVLYPECDCGKEPSIEEYCMNPLDREFFLPGYLTKQALDLTSETLLKTYFRIKEDITQDGVDGQAPNAPNMR